MQNEFKLFLDACGSIITSRIFTVSIVMTIAAGYGLLVVHPTVNWDFSLYKGNPCLVAATFFLMGRWGFSLLALITSSFAPMWNDLLACCILFFAVVCWCALWKVVSRGRLSASGILLFALLFVSYPLNHEIVLFPLAFPAICSGYWATGMALYFAYAFQENKRWSILALALVMQSFAVSIYQPFAVVYLCGTFALVLLRGIYCEEKIDRSLFLCWLATVKYIAILAGAILLWWIISKVPRLIFEILFFHLPTTGGAADEIAWFNGRVNFVTHLALMLKGIIYHFFYSALFYEALQYFLLSSILLITTAVIYAIRKRSWGVLYLAVGLVACNFALSFVQGTPTYYRACQSFSLLVGVSWMIIYCMCRNRRGIRYFIMAIGMFMVLSQTRDLSQWFYNNYRRFEMDKNNFQAMVDRLQAQCGQQIDKPVAVIGKVHTYATLRNDEHPFAYLPKKGGPSERNGENRFSSVGVRREFYLFARHVCGFLCRIPTADQVVLAQALARENMQPCWPREGYIREYREIIVINLGEGKQPGDAWLQSVKDSYLSDNERMLFKKMKTEETKKRIRDQASRIYDALE